MTAINAPSFPSDASAQNTYLQSDVLMPIQEKPVSAQPQWIAQAD